MGLMMKKKEPVLSSEAQPISLRLILLRTVIQDWKLSHVKAKAQQKQKTWNFS